MLKLKNKKDILWVGLVGLLVLIVALYKSGIMGTNNEKTISNEDIGGIYELKNGDIDYLIGKGKPVIIDFTATWCIPCKTFNPLLEKVYEDYKDQVIIKIIDVDKHKDIVSKFPVRVIPTQLFFDKDGNPYDPSNVGLLGFRAFSKDGSDKILLTLHEGAFSEEELLQVLEDMGVEVKR